MPVYKTAARFSLKLARKILKNRFPEHIFLNINIPAKNKGIMVTSLGRRIYPNQKIEARTDPRGKKYYWLSGKYLWE